jgi:hypothetical protein
MFGEPAWFDVFFPEEQTPLFGRGITVRRKIADMDLIGRYFNRRLETAFAGVAPNPYALRNTQGASLFLLCFAAANPNAVAPAIKIAQDILKRDAATALLPLGE